MNNYTVDASKEFSKTAKDGKRATKLCCSQKRKENIPESKTRKVFWFYFTLRCEEIANEYSQIVHGQSWKSIADLIFSTKLLTLPLKESQGGGGGGRSPGYITEILKQLNVDNRKCANWPSL